MPENRNRCKACRFNRCIQVGMSIEAVKMGRIPKAEKEKALMDEHEKHQREENMSFRNPYNNYQYLNNSNNFQYYNQQQQQQQQYTPIINQYQNHSNNLNYYQQQYTSSSSISSSSSSISPSPPLIPKYNSSSPSPSINNSYFMHPDKNENFEKDILTVPPLVTPTTTPPVSSSYEIPIEQEDSTKIDRDNVESRAVVEEAITTHDDKNNKSYELELNELIDQMHSLYLRDNEKVFNILQQARLYEKKERFDITIQTVWMGLVESIPQVVKSMIVFAKEIPGIKELKNTGDFAIMINNRLFDYFIVSLFRFIFSTR